MGKCATFALLACVEILRRPTEFRILMFDRDDAVVPSSEGVSEKLRPVEQSEPGQRDRLSLSTEPRGQRSVRSLVSGVAKLTSDRHFLM
jgi:hypothetical protein